MNPDALKNQIEKTETEQKEQTGLARIAEVLKEIKTLYKEAEKISDDIGFGFSAVDLGYGMGGWYVPLKQLEKDSDEDTHWEASDAGWQASSQSC